MGVSSQATHVATSEYPLARTKDVANAATCRINPALRTFLDNRYAYHHMYAVVSLIHSQAEFSFQMQSMLRVVQCITFSFIFYPPNTSLEHGFLDPEGKL